MKFLSILIVVVSVSAANRAQAPVSGSVSPGKSISLTFASATTTGNQLIVGMSDYYASSSDGESYSIADSYGNTWQKALDYQPGGRLIVFYAENIKGGAGHQVTITASPTVAYFIATAVEYTGLASSGSLDVSATSRATSTSYSSGPATTTSPNELLLGLHHVHATGVTFTPAPPWSQIGTVTGGAYHELTLQDQFVSTAGVYASTGTESAADDTISAMVTFKSAPVIPWTASISCAQVGWVPGNGTKGTIFSCILTSDLAAPVGGSLSFTPDPSTIWQVFPSPIVIPSGATSAPFTITGL